MDDIRDPSKFKNSEQPAGQIIAPSGGTADVTSPVTETTPIEPSSTSGPTAPPAAPVSQPQQPAEAAPVPSVPALDGVAQSDALATPNTIAQNSETDTPRKPSRTLPLKAILATVAALLVLAGVSAGAFMAGKHAVKSVAAVTPQPAAMTVPTGATMIEKCVAGLGAQYILPKDIPGGPVYNVYQGKVVGIEYMTDIATASQLTLDLENLHLFGQSYDHMNIMSMPGHAGYPKPHYQVDAMMISAAAASKITCGTTASDMSGMSGMSGSTGTSSSSPMPASTSTMH